MDLLSQKQAGRPYTPVHLGSDVVLDGSVCAMMAGPCAAESRDQIMRSAEFMAECGIRIFRAGCYKPRTNPYSFQGSGQEGLTWLAEVRRQFGLLIVSELRDASHFDEVNDVVDILQIGSKAMFNHALLKACGKSGKPVLLKRFFAATVQELMQMADYIMQEGNERVMLCERGIRTFEPSTRFSLDLCGAAVLQEKSCLPLVLDPSHAMGLRFAVPRLAKACLAFGCDALMLEVHPQVDEALCDKDQALTHEVFKALLSDLRRMSDVMGRKVV
ncbi:MAG: 3-deoxy-7-phosphoheptulonate synthase [Spartobacteria bacterium]|nr:3-deoxy-7-phosphoheptulonate synthase [Spartobacteria bacterium]